MNSTAWNEPSRMIRGFKHGRKGPLLIAQQHQTVWLLQGGADPRAWTKKEGGETWHPCRPPVDPLLIPIETLDRYRSEWKSSLAQRLEALNPNPFEESSIFEHCLGCRPSGRDEFESNAAAVRALRRCFERRGSTPPILHHLRSSEDFDVDEDDEASEERGSRRHVFLTDEAEALLEELFDEARFLNRQERVRRIRFHRSRAEFLRHQVIHARRLGWLRVWLDSLPGDALEAIRWMHRNGFRDRRWALLQTWLRVPEGRELFDDHPQLAWCLANSWLFKARPVERPLRSLRALVGQPRKRALRWLDLPGGHGTLALLRRIPCGDLDGKTGWRLARVLRDERALGMLHNLPAAEIDPVVIETLAFPEAFPISFQILKAFSANEPLPVEGRRTLSVRFVYDDCLRMISRADTEAAKERWCDRIRSTRSLAELWRVHEDLVAECNAAAAWGGIGGMRSSKPLGWEVEIAPPLPPAPWMEPISTVGHLLSEARKMAHCATSYAESVAKGLVYLYAVDHPEGRATLAIHRQQAPGRGGGRYESDAQATAHPPGAAREARWVWLDLRGFANADPSPALRREVVLWLAESQGN